VPKQARAAATFDKIIQAAVEVLVDKGLQGFNTNIVAEVAGVNVATVYHYFPDKNSILRELFERNEAVRIGFFRNPALLAAIAVAALLQAAVVTLPATRPVFDVRTDLGREWLLVIGLALVPLAVVEAGKWLAGAVRPAVSGR
jgi:AcrR family transcriptional regulator